VYGVAGSDIIIIAINCHVHNQREACQALKASPTFPENVVNFRQQRIHASQCLDPPAAILSWSPCYRGVIIRDIFATTCEPTVRNCRQSEIVTWLHSQFVMLSIHFFQVCTTLRKKF